MLYLMRRRCDTEKENQAVFTGLIQAKALGLTRSIGVSSFSVEQIQQLLSLNQDVPAVNQCQMAVGSHDDETRAFCELHNITYQAWSPIGHVNFADPKLVRPYLARSSHTARLLWQVLWLSSVFLFSKVSLLSCATLVEYWSR